MRGVISLAAALALPNQVASGLPFPDRDLIIFLTFCVILATLVGQGLLFPAVIRAVNIEDDTRDQDEELNARLEIAFASDFADVMEAQREGTAETGRYGADLGVSVVTLWQNRDGYPRDGDSVPAPRPPSP